MKQNGTSRKEAVERLKEIVANAWKVVNEESMRPTIIPMQVVAGITNVARVVEVAYKKVDAIAKPEYLKDHVTKLFIDPIPI